MKLVITVTDENDGQGARVEAVQENPEQVLTSARGPIRTFDGGPMPAILLDMESEVAAGRRNPPGR